MRKKHFPFVLSGGGARGFAHIGVLKAMEEAGIYPKAIAATSAGAIAGALIADGYSPDEVRELVLSTINRRFLFNWKDLGQRLMSLHKLGEFLKQNLRHQQIEDLPIPFYPSATDYRTGLQRIFTEGPVVDAVLAASSIPIIFPPHLIGGVPYVDGGVCSNLPTEVFKAHRHEIIAVNVNPIAPLDEATGFLKNLDRVFHLSLVQRVREAAEGCHLFIEPPTLAEYGLFDIDRLQEIYAVGYDYAKGVI
jgi:NTE family protein